MLAWNVCKTSGIERRAEAGRFRRLRGLFYHVRDEAVEAENVEHCG